METKTLGLRIVSSAGFRGDQIIELHRIEAGRNPGGSVTYTTDTTFSQKKLRGIRKVLTVGDSLPAGGWFAVLWDLKDYGTNFPTVLPVPPTPGPFQDVKRASWLVLKNPKECELHPGMFRTTGDLDLTESLSRGQQVRFYLSDSQPQ